MAFLECYLDESGTHGSAEVCTVAGYVGGKGQLKKFENLWNSALLERHVPYFHAKEFWGRDNKGKRLGPYVGWDDAKDEKFLNSLGRAIVEYKIYPISGTIFNEEFFKWNERLRRYFTGGQVRNAKFVTTGSPRRPYYMAFLLCVTAATEFVPVGNSLVHYFCGLDRVMRGYAADFLGQIKEHPDSERRERMGDIDFPLASETAPLQAADLLAYLTYQHSLNKAKEWNAQPCDLLRLCLQRTQSLEHHTYLNRDGLELLLSEMRPALREWLLKG